jgi:signal transduction histidine kinase
MLSSPDITRVALSGDEKSRTDRASRLLARAFTPRVAYAVIALFLLGLGAVSVRYHSSLSAELTDAVVSRRAGLAQLAAATLSERLDRTVDLAMSLATRVRFAELVASGNWDAAIGLLRDVPQEFPYVDRLFLSDLRGIVVADFPERPNVRGENFSRQDWYRGVSREWKTHVSEVYKTPAQPQLNVIAVAAPIRDRLNGKVAGILVLQLSLERFFDWVKAIGLGPGVSLFVVDARGQAGYASGVSAQAPIADLSTNPAVRQLRNGRAGAEVAMPENAREERLYAFVPAKHDWGVVIEEPASMAFAARERQLRFVEIAYALTTLLMVAVAWIGMRIVGELKRTRKSLANHAERLRILREIDRAVAAEEAPEAIAAAVIQPLREILGVPRAIVNRFDLAAGEVEWVAAAGRRRTHVGPGVRYSMRLMGDVDALRRGEPQRIDVHALPPGPETQALLASGVHVYMAVPMIAGGELIGAISFGGAPGSFPNEQIAIAREVATQLAIAISQARLLERVKGHATELESRVRSRTAELEAANRELGSFSYSVSHDLRAPLRAVDGYARMLEEDYGERLDAEGRRLLGVVRDSARGMGQLIDDLLEFSRLGRQELAKRHIDMTPLVQEVVNELQRDAQATVHIDAVPPANADRALLRQVWLNLIANALKYSSKQDCSVVQIGGKADGGEHVYWVRDNGVGFDMRYADKLFGVFQRLHRSDEFPGTGVGLAIVQRVVTRHGGRVWAEGQVGKGACFFFSLPAGV